MTVEIFFEPVQQHRSGIKHHAAQCEKRHIDTVCHSCAVQHFDCKNHKCGKKSRYQRRRPFFDFVNYKHQRIEYHRKRHPKYCLIDLAIHRVARQKRRHHKRKNRNIKQQLIVAHPRVCNKSNRDTPQDDNRNRRRKQIEISVCQTSVAVCQKRTAKHKHIFEYAAFFWHFQYRSSHHARRHQIANYDATNRAYQTSVKHYFDTDDKTQYGN